MAGLLRPYAAYKLVKTLRDEVGIPIHLHTHDTSGINAATILKAADAGVHVADGAISAISGTTSQPEPELDRRRARAHRTRYWPELRGPESLFRLLGNSPDLLCAI